MRVLSRPAHLLTGLFLLLLIPVTANAVHAEFAFMMSSPGEDACSPATPASRFTPASSNAWLYSLVRNAQAGDRIDVHFFRPDGDTHSIINFDPLPSDGDWCFPANIAIAGEEAANHLGLWTVVGYHNDSLLFAVDFEIVAEPPIGCAYALAPSIVQFPSSGAESGLIIFAAGGCSWTATSDEPWVTFADQDSGAGSDVILYDVARNDTGIERTALISVGDQILLIVQDPGATAACSFALSPATANVEASGGTGLFFVTTGEDCAWAAVSDREWIHPAPTVGVGSGQIGYSVDPNLTATPRSGSIQVGEATFTINQAAASGPGPVCAYTISPASGNIGAAGGDVSFNLNADAGCNWTAAATEGWIHLSTSSGSGPAQVRATVDPNPSASPRSGVITAGGQTFTVQQAGATSSGGPRIADDGVTNAASFASAQDGVAPGSHISIFGDGFGPDGFAVNSAWPIPATLRGVQVQVRQDGATHEAYLTFASRTQVNAILSSAIAPGEAEVVVLVNGQPSNAAPILIVASAPGLFFSQPAGMPLGIVQNVKSQTEYPLNTAQAPGQPGQIAILWVTGLGAIDGPDNQPPPGGDMGLEVEVRVGGYPARVLYAGRAPGFAGVDNIYIEIPAEANLGCYCVVEVSVSGRVSNAINISVTSQGEACTPPPSPARQTVGPGGGVVSAGGASISVPSGAFQRASDLELAPISVGSEGVYEIRGFPTQYSEPVKISLPLDPADDLGDDAFILVRSNLDPTRGPIYLRATRNGGMLEAELPARLADQDLPTESDYPNRRYGLADQQAFSAVMTHRTGYRELMSDGGHFRVHYPTEITLDDQKLQIYAVATLNNAERAYDLIKALGVDVSRRTAVIDIWLFSFSGNVGRIFAMDADWDGATDSTVWGKSTVGISVNLDKAKQDVNEAYITVAHELLHVFQAIYNPKSFVTQTFSESAWLWMLESTATWFEWHYSRDRSRLSTNVRGNAAFLFRSGLELRPVGFFGNRKVRHHGYGTSLFVRYLVDTELRDSKVVGNWIKRLGESDRRFPTAVEGLNIEVANMDSRWVRFVWAYLDGKVHPKLDLADVIGAVEVGERARVTHLIKPDAPTGQVKTWSWTSPAFSALPFFVQVKKGTNQWATGTKLRIRLGSTQAKTEARIYRRDGGDQRRLAATIAAGEEFEMDAVQLVTKGSFITIVVADGGMFSKPTQANPQTVDITLEQPVTGLAMTTVREQVSKDYTGSEAEWRVDAPGVAIDAKRFQTFSATGGPVNVLARITKTEAPINRSGCFMGWGDYSGKEICEQYTFEGFSKTELYCDTCPEDAKVLDTGSVGSWLAGKDLQLPASTKEFIGLYLRLYFKYHHKQWVKESNETVFDRHAEDFDTHTLTIMRK